MVVRSRIRRIRPKSRSHQNGFSILMLPRLAFAMQFVPSHMPRKRRNQRLLPNNDRW